MAKRIALAAVALVLGSSAWAQEGATTGTTSLAQEQAVSLIKSAHIAQLSKKDRAFHANLNISRNSKNSLCWQVQLSARHQQAVTVTEYIHAPGQIFFGGPGVIALHNGDRTQYTLTSLAQPDDAGHIQRCWAFESSDPLGDYHIRLEINQQPVLHRNFRLVP